jgi:transposase-like protein
MPDNYIYPYPFYCPFCKKEMLESDISRDWFKCPNCDYFWEITTAGNLAGYGFSKIRKKKERETHAMD